MVRIDRPEEARAREDNLHRIARLYAVTAARILGKRDGVVYRVVSA